MMMEIFLEVMVSNLLYLNPNLTHPIAIFNPKGLNGGYNWAQNTATY